MSDEMPAAVTPPPEIVEVARRLTRESDSPGVGFDRVMFIQGSTYRDRSTIVVMPSREPAIDYRITAALYSMVGPMNQKKSVIMCIGDEVGHAYNNLIRGILSNPDLSKYKYVMTVESDNLVPTDAHIRLLETIEAGLWDGVSGIYFTKGDLNMPMAYGDPAKFESTGELDFNPRDITTALKQGQIMPVNGIAMGCALWRMDLFRDPELGPPWFVTVNDVVDGKLQGFTQDLWFCKKARQKGRRFAVDLRVKVGHMDLATGKVY